MGTPMTTTTRELAPLGSLPAPSDAIAPDARAFAWALGFYGVFVMQHVAVLPGWLLWLLGAASAFGHASALRERCSTPSHSPASLLGRVVPLPASPLQLGYHAAREPRLRGRPPVAETRFAHLAQALVLPELAFFQRHLRGAPLHVMPLVVNVALFVALSRSLPAPAFVSLVLAARAGQAAAFLHERAG
jgi:hypothetical protein